MANRKNNTTTDNVGTDRKRALRISGWQPIAAGAVILIFGVVVVFAWISYRDNQNNYVFAIDDRKYSRAAVEEQTQYPVEVEKKRQSSAAADLYELLHTVEAGKSLGIDLSDQAIETYRQHIYKNQEIKKADQKKYNEWFTLQAKYRAVMQAVASDNVEGYIYDFYFGHHIEYGPRYRPDNLGNKQLINQDKKYAKERAEYYKNALEQSRLTPEQALKEVQQDIRLNQGGGLESNKTRHFKSVDGLSWRQQLFNDEDIVNVIEKLRAVNQPSGIMTSRALASPSAKEKEDISYYFVYLASANSGKITSVDLSKALEEINTSYKGY